MSLVSFRYSIFLFAGTILTLFDVAIIHRRTAAAARTRSHDDPQQQQAAVKKERENVSILVDDSFVVCFNDKLNFRARHTTTWKTLRVLAVIALCIFFAQVRQRWTISNFSCSSSGFFFAAKKEEAESGNLVLMELLRLYDLLQICHFLRASLSLFGEVFFRRVFQAFSWCDISLFLVRFINAIFLLVVLFFAQVFHTYTQLNTTNDRKSFTWIIA